MVRLRSFLFSPPFFFFSLLFLKSESEEKEEAGEGHDHDEFMEEHDEDHEASAVKRKTPGMVDFLRDIDYKNVEADSDKWAKEFLAQNYLILSRKTLDPSTCELPPTILIKDQFDHPDGGGHSSRGHTINMKPDLTLREMADLIYSSGTKEQKNKLSFLATKGLPLNENCLVENWVGSGRYAFIDLSAGPFSWGPQAGGNGLKTTRLFPDFEGRLSDAKARYRPLAPAGQTSNAGGRKPLRANGEEGEDETPLDYEYPEGEGDGMYFDDDEYNGWSDDDNTENQMQDDDDSKPPAHMLKEDMEEDVFLGLMDRYCNSVTISTYKDFCTKLVSKFQLIEYARKKDLVGPKLPFRKYASFATVDKEEHTFEGHLAALTEDFGVQLADILSRKFVCFCFVCFWFFWSLGLLVDLIPSFLLPSFLPHHDIKGTLRHLITPVSLNQPYQRKEHWAFQIYLVVNHKDYNPASPADMAFDLDLFKKEILKLKLPSQEFSFVLNTLDQANDNTLALAFRTSLHTANVQIHDKLGQPIIERRTYLDSGHLREQLVAQNEDGGILFPHSSSISKSSSFPLPLSLPDERHPKKLLPIFIFSVNTPEPIFIDKVYQVSLGILNKNDNN